MPDPKDPGQDPLLAALAAVQQLEGQLQVDIKQAQDDVGAARTINNTKDLLEHLIELHKSSLQISERILKTAEIRHLENKDNFKQIVERIDLMREFFDADMKRISAEIVSLREGEIADLRNRMDAHMVAIREQLGALLKQKLG
jgi:hypothetical protein